MNRREFLSSSAAFASAAALAPSALFAAQAPAASQAPVLQPNPAAYLGETINSAPAMPSILVMRAAAASGDIVRIWRTPDELRAGVASGLYRVMMSPTNVCAMLAAKGFRVGYVNFLTGGLTSVLSRGAAVQNLGDLRGKKIIAAFKNDMPDIVLKTLLDADGISGLDITYAATPAEAMALFLAKKSFDAAYLPEPAASACVLKARAAGEEILRGFNAAALWQKRFGSRMFQAGMIARRDFADAHAAALSAFNEELLRALDWVQNYPDEAAKTGEALLNMPAPALKAALAHSNLCAVPASAAREEILEFLGILHRFNPALVGGKLPDAGLFLL